MASPTYLRGLKLAIRGAWAERLLLWSAVTPGMDWVIADLEIFIEQLNERAENRVKTKVTES
jgi:hypothetical protein